FTQSAHPAPALNKPASEHSTLSIVASKASRQIAARLIDRLCHTQRIQRRLGHPRPDVRPCDEGRIPEKRHPTDDNPGRDEVIDGLEKRLLSTINHVGYRTSPPRPPAHPPFRHSIPPAHAHVRHDIRPDQRRWYRRIVQPSFTVRAEIR